MRIQGPFCILHTFKTLDVQVQYEFAGRVRVIVGPVVVGKVGRHWGVLDFFFENIVLVQKQDDGCVLEEGIFNDGCKQGATLFQSIYCRTIGIGYRIEKLPKSPFIPRRLGSSLSFIIIARQRRQSVIGFGKVSSVPLVLQR